MMISIDTLTESDIYNLFHVKQQRRGAGNSGGFGKGRRYKDLVCAFDIETTRLTTADIDEHIPDFDNAIMYIWQFCINGEVTVYGRTWEQFMGFLESAKKACGGKTWIVVFVHNLSYEFQFLSGIYNFSKDDVFAVDSRKVLKCDMLSHFEFRCSYLHSNMSLDEYTHKMGVHHAKIEGFDYNKKRFPWTSLNSSELAYCENDVLGLVEAIKIEMAHDGDNLYTFPLTSTGYVRRDAKRAMRHTPPGYVENMFPDWKTYQLLRMAFRGGNTHANRYYTGKILSGVSGADRSSSYPAVLVNKKFPVSKFIYDENLTFNHVIDVITRRRRACLIKLRLTDVKLHNPFWGCPYLSRDKCETPKNRILGGVYDNGRILEADLIPEVVFTDIDLKIILDEYDFNADILEFAHARYGDLPPAFKDEILKYYRAKTELKNVAGKELLYMKSKNKLNSLYGMCAQNPAKQQFLYNGMDFTLDQEKSCEAILEEKSKHPFLPYQWGVWCTAWARWELEEMMKEVEKQNAYFVYTDTDSVKYLGEVDWTAYNEKQINESTKSGAFATDPAGITHYMGVAEMEWDKLKEFSTMGAKKYCYRVNDASPLITTIAGVSKKKGGKELEERGGIKAFKEGFIFTEAGGLESIYNDDISAMIHIEGIPLYISKNVSLRPSTYTLGLTSEYRELVERCNEVFRFDKFRNYAII